MATDLYLVLGVGQDASPQQIKAAYRHRAKELHPDVHGPDREPFLRMQQAYSVLSDPERRRVYDNEQNPGRAPGRRRRSRAEPMRATGRGGIEFSFRDVQNEYRPSFDELFDRLWSNFTLANRPKAEALERLTVEILLTPEEAASGGVATIQVPARAECSSCMGHGAVGPYECWRCQGQGAITAQYPLEIEYPAGMRNEHIIQVPLDTFGITNFYLTVRLRVSAEM